MMKIIHSFILILTLLLIQFNDLQKTRSNNGNQLTWFGFNSNNNNRGIYLVNAEHNTTFLPCGCTITDQIIDTCGFPGGGAGQPPANETTDDSVVCSDCGGGLLPDHCGVCGGCQLPFVAVNVTPLATTGGLQAGNKLGSITALSMDHITCGQYHHALISPIRATDPWAFAPEPSPPALPMPLTPFVQQKLTQVKGNSLGHAVDGSNNYVLIGNHLTPDVKKASLYGRIELDLSNPTNALPFGYYFDYTDPCGGNQYGYDVAIDELYQIAIVCDPKAYFVGTAWVYYTTSPTPIVQNITGGQTPLTNHRGDRFCHSVSADDAGMVASRINCQDGTIGAGCLHFFRLNTTTYQYTLTTLIVNGPSPQTNEGLGNIVSMSGNWTFVGYSNQPKVEVYQQTSPGVWVWFQTITPPNGVTPGSVFGHALVVKQDRAAIGDENALVAPSSSARGAVYTYRLQGGMWQLWSTYTDSLDSFDTHFGAAVDISDNLEWLVVGVPNAPLYGKCTLISLNVTQCFGCDDVYNSCLITDECGVCNGNNTACAGCDGVPNSGKILDYCGVCDGDNSSCIDIMPLNFSVPCNSNQSTKPTPRSIVLDYEPAYPPPYTGNSTSGGGWPVSWSIISATPDPSFYSFSYNATTGKTSLVFTPPFNFQGTYDVTLEATRLPLPAPSRPNPKTSASPRPSAETPPSVTAQANITITVELCIDCNGTMGTGYIFDACGVCGGDNSTCEGCDNVPNSGKEIDYCGVCGGNNCTCLDVFLPPITGPYPCNQKTFFTPTYEPADKNVKWQLTTPPTYGTVIINTHTGVFSYQPPPESVVVGPTDSFQISAISTSCSPPITTTVTVNINTAEYNYTSCQVIGCDNVTNSGMVFDRCGVCGGNGSTCIPPPVCDPVCIGITLFPFLLMSCLVGFIWLFVSNWKSPLPSNIFNTSEPDYIEDRRPVTMVDANNNIVPLDRTPGWAHTNMLTSNSDLPPLVHPDPNSSSYYGTNFQVSRRIGAQYYNHNNNTQYYYRYI